MEAKSILALFFNCLVGHYPTPIILMLLLTGRLSLFTSLGLMFYTFILFPRKLAKDFHGFPDAVAAKLRVALWYTGDKYFDAEKALQGYREAFVLAQKEKMDPFGDQYLGMRLQLAAFFEKIQFLPRAIEILEQERATYLSALDILSTKPEMEDRRAQILFKTVALNLKLAEYYSHGDVHNDEAAEERLVWAVTAILKEEERLEGGLSSTESEPAMSKEQMGATLEGTVRIIDSTHSKTGMA